MTTVLISAWTSSEQCQRTIERAEDFEQSSREIDTRVRETQERSKEMETLVANNMEKEETFEAKVKVLNLILLEFRAYFRSYDI